MQLNHHNVYVGVYDDHLLNNDAELAQYQVFFILFLTLLVKEGDAQCAYVLISLDSPLLAEIVNSSDSDLSAVFLLVLFGPFALLLVQVFVDAFLSRARKTRRLQEKYVNAFVGANSTYGEEPSLGAVELSEVQKEEVSVEEEEEDRSAGEFVEEEMDFENDYGEISEEEGEEDEVLTADKPFMFRTLSSTGNFV